MAPAPNVAQVGSLEDGPFAAPGLCTWAQWRVCYNPEGPGTLLLGEESPRFPLKGSLKGDIDVGIDRVQVPHY